MALLLVHTTCTYSVYMCGFWTQLGFLQAILQVGQVLLAVMTSFDGVLCCFRSRMYMRHFECLARLCASAHVPRPSITYAVTLVYSTLQHLIASMYRHCPTAFLLA